jgi:hypothetical protein
MAAVEVEVLLFVGSEVHSGDVVGGESERPGVERPLGDFGKG